MKIPQLLAGLSLAASLFLTSVLSTAQAQKAAGKPTSAPPSVIGGAPIQVAVYNYRNNPLTPYWVTPNGILQPLPGAGPVPPMTGSTPTILQSFGGATLVLKGPKGGGGWKHFVLNGTNPARFFVLGTPPPGAALPPGYKGKTAAGTGGSGPGGTPAATPGTPPTVVNKSVVNKTVVNNPPPASTPAPPAKGRKRGAKAPDVNIVVNPPAPSETPSTPSTTPTDPPAPTPAGAPVAAVKDDPEGDLQLSAEDPRVVEFLRIHNAARADVGVSPLEWSEDLASTAQEWAEHLLHAGKLEPQPDSEYGANLASGKGNFTPASAANAWLAEKSAYSPDNVEYRVTTISKGKGGKTEKHEADAKTVHYSQMVWGKSTMVGVGVATGKGGKVVIVANYNPRGNVKGEKAYGQ